ncbi:MAG TPA: right-handed parallel beta-helix repeat-containing protein [Acidimicrobiia bacterium]|nr:right-handed parallel beta-helix repeat-containing protein [Acidimicrobiia bacterium]
MRARLGLVAPLAVLAIAACAGPPDGQASPPATGDTSSESPTEWSGNTRNVPADYPTIQAAVDAAQPGDLILIDRGVYREAVDVTTPGLVIRGVDRNEVIIDGEFERDNGIRALFTDGVVVENLTTMNHTQNGVFWSGVRGYRASYVTAVNNGDYGIYAFDSGDGLFEHSYASGSPDASYYIGQCNPCNAVITHSIGEHSGLGYSGTNASTEIYIVDSVFAHNGTGLAPNSLDSELLPPVENVVIAGNLIHDNGYGEFPHKGAQWAGQGMGVALAGAQGSLITRNLVVNHPGVGIHVLPNIDENVYMSGDNTVSENVVMGSGLADLALSGMSRSGNCFEENEVTYTLPVALQGAQPCEGLRFPALWQLGAVTEQLGRIIEFEQGLDDEVFYGDMPHPPDQPQMPEGADATVTPAVSVFASAKPDLDAIAVPAMPSDLEVTQEKGIDIMGVTFASTFGAIVGLYAYVLPIVLYAAWVVIAIWEIIGKREDLSAGAELMWILAVLILPFVGVLAYYIVGKSQIPASHRWVLLAGGLGAYALFLALGLVIGGVV